MITYPIPKLKTLMKTTTKPSSLLIYSFNKKQFLPDLLQIWPDIFVLSKLSQEIRSLTDLIKEQQPKHVLGIAQSYRANWAYFQPNAINLFHKRGRVEATGPKQLSLFVPNLSGTIFKKSPRASSTFCNWTIYKIAYFINQNNLTTKPIFAHCQAKHLEQLAKILKNIPSL